MENSKLEIFNNAFNGSVPQSAVNNFNQVALVSKLGIVAPTIYTVKAVAAIFEDDREVWTKAHYNMNTGDDDLYIYVKDLDRAQAINFCIRHVFSFLDPKDDDPNFKHYTRVHVYHTNEQGEDTELHPDDGQYFTDMMDRFGIDYSEWWGTWFETWEQLNPELVDTEEEADARPYWIPGYQKLYFNILKIAFGKKSKTICKTEVVYSEYFDKTYFYIMTSKLAIAFLVDNISNLDGYESALPETLIKFGFNVPAYVLISTLA